MANTEATRDLLDRRRQVLGSAYRLFYDDPVRPVRGNGVELFDAAGRRFLDAYNNVPIVGHCHPRVVEAQCRQAELLNTHTRYLTEGVVRYAEKLLATLASHIDRCMFTCTGSEAIDLALRIARMPGRKQGVIITTNAYHGITALAAAVTPSLGPSWVQEPWVRTVAVPRDVPMEHRSEVFATSVRQAIAELESTEYGFSALLLDMAMSSDGLWLEPQGFIATACQEAQDAGGIVIADEVQAGFCRTGSSFWGHQYNGVSPDLVVMGKSMANGLPVGAVVGRAQLIDAFGSHGRYFNTYGGNPVCMAAAEAVLDVIADEGLQGNAHQVGRLLNDELREIAFAYPQRIRVRGAGLFAAIEFRDDSGALDGHRATRAANAFRHAGILVGQSGPDNTSVKIRPPLPFSAENVDEVVSNAARIVAEVN